MDRRTLVTLGLFGGVIVLLIVAQAAPWWTSIRTWNTGGNDVVSQTDYFGYQAVSRTVNGNTVTITTYHYDTYNERQNAGSAPTAVMMTMAAMVYLLILLAILCLVGSLLCTVSPQFRARVSERRWRAAMLMLSGLMFVALVMFSFALSSSTGAPLLGSESGNGFRFSYFPSLGWFALLVASLLMGLVALTFRYTPAPAVQAVQPQPASTPQPQEVQPPPPPAPPQTVYAPPRTTTPEREE